MSEKLIIAHRRGLQTAAVSRKDCFAHQRQKNRPRWQKASYCTPIRAEQTEPAPAIPILVSVSPDKPRRKTPEATVSELRWTFDGGEPRTPYAERCLTGNQRAHGDGSCGGYLRQARRKPRGELLQPDQAPGWLSYRPGRITVVSSGAAQLCAYRCMRTSMAEALFSRPGRGKSAEANLPLQRTQLTVSDLLKVIPPKNRGITLHKRLIC